MRDIFLGVCLCIAIVVLISFISLKKKESPKYTCKKALSNVEQVAYWRLVEAMGENKVVLAQVAFSSFISIDISNKLGFIKFNRARQKVADFVICNKDFSIYATLEVDDSSHDEEKDRKRDAILAEAGIKTFRILAKEIPSANELRNAILG